jgi:hypothetical protein
MKKYNDNIMTPEQFRKHKENKTASLASRRKRKGRKVKGQ